MNNQNTSQLPWVCRYRDLKLTEESFPCRKKLTTIRKLDSTWKLRIFQS